MNQISGQFGHGGANGSFSWFWASVITRLHLRNRGATPKQEIDFSRIINLGTSTSARYERRALEPNVPDTHYNLALTLKYKGDAKEAVEGRGPPDGANQSGADAHYGLLGATVRSQRSVAAALKGNAPGDRSRSAKRAGAPRLWHALFAAERSFGR